MTATMKPSGPRPSAFTASVTSCGRRMMVMACPNMAAPTIDYYTQPRVYGYPRMTEQHHRQQQVQQEDKQE